MITKLIGVREFRQNMAGLYEKAKKNNWRFIVLNRNKPIFRIEPLDEKEAILEKLVYDVEEARKEVKRGRVYDFEEACKELGL